MPVAEPRDVVIIGSGPAGLTAAIYTARANLHPLVIEGEPSSNSDQPGGQLMLTTEVENYPGFIDGIMGPELMGNMRAQAARFGAEFRTVKVGKIDLSGPPHRLVAHDEEIEARAVIVATGARALMLDLANERRLMGYGVSTCATCDGFFHRGHEIAVVGGGDSALEEALFLTKFASKVHLIHRRRELRASKIMQERAFKNDKIELVWDTVVSDVLGETAVDGLALRNLVTSEESTLPVHGLFVAIGHVPNTDLFKGWLDMEDTGYLLTKHGSTFTNIEGVFAAGDVQDHVYRQAVTAAGSGCMAAIDAERWLEATHTAEHQIVETPRNW
jgi:thioredoxin reductase (NADPH)